jgi:hypothetical protein
VWRKWQRTFHQKIPEPVMPSTAIVYRYVVKVLCKRIRVTQKENQIFILTEGTS